MKKTLIAAVAAVAIVGASAAGYHAYARYDGGPRGHFGRMSADDMSAYADARIAALRAGLRLSAEQEQFWPPVEDALSELADKRIERRVEWRERREERRERREERRTERRDRDGDRTKEERRADRNERRNPVERLRDRAERLSETGADLQRLAEAAEPLYNALDDAQKRRFQRLARGGMRTAAAGQRMRHFHRGRGDRDDDRNRGPRGGERLEWQEDAPQGAERL